MGVFESNQTGVEAVNTTTSDAKPHLYAVAQNIEGGTEGHIMSGTDSPAFDQALCGFTFDTTKAIHHSNTITAAKCLAFLCKRQF